LENRSREAKEDVAEMVGATSSEGSLLAAHNTVRAHGEWLS